VFSKQSANEIAAVARRLRVEPAALLAVATVESGGIAFASINGRKEPLIRFEGHYFDRRLTGEKQKLARDAGLADPTPGVVANPASQAARWAMLTRAAAIDRKAAHESTSWGIGQVMGAHWAWLGYTSVAALVEEARGGVAGQARLMARYIGKAGLAEALRAHDWVAFARGYNGPAYARNRYDARLRKTYLDLKKPAVAEHPAVPVLRRGSRGMAVRRLQRALADLGYTLAVDGDFGPETQAVVTLFQRDHGLKIDGVAGTETQEALRQTSRGASSALDLWTWMVRWLRRLLNCAD
jgi:hypothetical protein